MFFSSVTFYCANRQFLLFPSLSLPFLFSFDGPLGYTTGLETNTVGDLARSPLFGKSVSSGTLHDHLTARIYNNSVRAFATDRLCLGKSILHCPLEYSSIFPRYCESHLRLSLTETKYLCDGKTNDDYLFALHALLVFNA